MPLVFRPGEREYMEQVAQLRDGARVNVTAMRCTACGEDILASMVEDDDEGRTLRPLGAFSVAAAVIREIANLPHTDDCPGPIQWETESVSTPPDGSA